MLLKKILSLLKLKCKNCRDWIALGFCCNKECKFFKQNSLPFGWYLCKQNLDVELTDGIYGSFLEGKKYYLEVIDNGYFVRDDFQQLIKMPENIFKDNFTQLD